VTKKPHCPTCGGSNTGDNAVPGRSVCRSCKRAKDREYGKANAERIRQRAKQYAQDNREKVREYHRRYYIENKQQAKDRASKWREGNLERAKATRRKRYQETKQEHLAAYKRWAEANPEKAKATSANRLHRRRARERQVDVREVKRKEIEKLFLNGCAFPRCTNTNLELDHIVPLFLGGRHAIGNLQALCKSHNASKGARTWMQFLQMKGVA
jgi:5-methylcytosine-specific restriction endonuclease McrA